MIHRIEIAIRKGLPDPRGEHVAARDVDLVIEAVFEDLELKKEIFRKMCI